MLETSKRQKKGFTLAEVLITLGIIGIVAAMTIPTLMKNYQRTMYVASLKKAYAEVTEALRLMANDYGCPNDLKCTNIFKWNALGDVSDNNNALGDVLSKYIKAAKVCKASLDYTPNAEDTKCLSNSINDYYDASGESYDMNMGHSFWYRMITADGFSLALVSDGCENNWAPSSTNYNVNQVCGKVWIDVNGLKGPNNMGRDLFLFYITNGKGPALYPEGGSEFLENGTSWKDPSGKPVICTEEQPYGEFCAGRIMEEGWQMKYEDPNPKVMHSAPAD